MKYIIACMFAFAVAATAFAQDNNNNNSNGNNGQNSQSMPNGANDDPGDNYARSNPGSFGDTSSREPNVNEYDDYSGKVSGTGSQQNMNGGSNSVDNGSASGQHRLSSKRASGAEIGRRREATGSDATQCSRCGCGGRAGPA